MRSEAAASLSACAVRLATRLVLPLNTLPCVIWVPGHSPSQLAKCPSALKRVIADELAQGLGHRNDTTGHRAKVADLGIAWRICYRDVDAVLVNVQAYASGHGILS